jgi:hypothetical protein
MTSIRLATQQSTAASTLQDPRECEGRKARQHTAMSLLNNLEMAQQGRSMLLSVKQKLLLKEGKKGFA